MRLFPTLGLPSLDNLVHNLIAGVVVFALCLVVAAYVFAGKRFGQTIGGFFRMLGALFYAPFVHLKQVCTTLADVVLRGEKDVAESKQYLLNRFLTLLEALLFVVVVGIFANGLLGGWNAMMPPKYVREQLHAQKESVKELRKDLAISQPKLSELESVWSQRRDSLMRAHGEERNRRIAAADSENLAIKGKLAHEEAYLSTLRSIEQAYVENQSRRRPESPDRVRSLIAGQVDRSSMALDIRSLVLTFNNNCYSAAQARQELSTVTEYAVRNAVQPDYADLKSHCEQLQARVQGSEEQLATLQVQASWKVWRFLVELITSLLRIIGFVWLFGILIEALWLAVDLADNVRHIRRKCENKS